MVHLDAFILEETENATWTFLSSNSIPLSVISKTHKILTYLIKANGSNKSGRLLILQSLFKNFLMQLIYWTKWTDWEDAKIILSHGSNRLIPFSVLCNYFTVCILESCSLFRAGTLERPVVFYLKISYRIIVNWHNIKVIH